MFRKALRDITPDDLQGLRARQAEEDISTEFKGALATRDGEPDRWVRGEDRIGDPAKRDLIKELVAFANTDGGMMFLGIEEDGEKRAHAIAPIRDCRALADRLGQACIAGVDPPLTSLEVFGVETAGTAGVVVFRVPSSHLAPHRAKDGMECYFRQGDKSVPMSMLQVRDLAVRRVSALQNLRTSFNERAAKLIVPETSSSELLEGKGYVPRVNVGIRATAIPLERAYIGDLIGRQQLHLQTPSLVIERWPNRPPVQLYLDQPWSPVLRGMRTTSSDYGEHVHLARFMRSDGLTEVTQIRPETFLSSGVKGVHLRNLLWTFAQLLISVEAVRRLLGRPELAFGLDFEWRFPHGAGILVPYADFPVPNSWQAIEAENRVTDHEMPPASGLNAFWRGLQAEVLSSFGMRNEHVSDLDFATAIEQSLSGTGY